MDNNLSFSVMVHTKEDQQNVDKGVKGFIITYLKTQYSDGIFRNVKVTKNQVQQGLIYFTIFKVEVEKCKGLKAFSLVELVHDYFKGSIATTIQITNLYMDA